MHTKITMCNKITASIKQEGVGMRKNLYCLVALIASGALVAGLVSSVTTLALVPGNNEAIDITTSGGTPSVGGSYLDSSQDGRFIVFASTATNLVSPSTNGQRQIFVKDRLTNTTTLVSVSSSGVQGNSTSMRSKISSNGRFVVFASRATNLVANDTNGDYDIFVRDLTSNTTQLVSKNAAGVYGNEGSDQPDISSDGQYVVFVSSATNLVSSPTSTFSQAYIKNLSTGDIKVVSQSSSGVAANATSSYLSISCEGRFVVFQSSANNLVSGDINSPAKGRIYIVDMLKPINPMYIKGDADQGMAYPSISCSGNYISFVSMSSNIVTGDTNGFADTFVYDRINATFERVSVDSAGNEGNGGTSTDYVRVSDDGKLVVFHSNATNMVSGDTNGVSDIFLRNRQAGTTELISRDASGVIGNGASLNSIMSPDGRYVIYTSRATNLVSGFGNSTSGMLYSSETGLSNEY